MINVAQKLENSMNIQISTGLMGYHFSCPHFLPASLLVGSHGDPCCESFTSSDPTRSTKAHDRALSFLGDC